MAESFYWFTQIPTTFYVENEYMRYILSSKDDKSKLTAYVYHRLLCESAKDNGRIYGSENRIAIKLDFDPKNEDELDKLRAIIKTLEEYEFITVKENQIFVVDFDKFVGKENTRAKKARDDRKRKASIADDDDPEASPQYDLSGLDLD